MNFWRGFEQTFSQDKYINPITDSELPPLDFLVSFICRIRLFIFIFSLFMAKHFGHVPRTWAFLGNFSTWCRSFPRRWRGEKWGKCEERVLGAWLTALFHCWWLQQSMAYRNYRVVPSCWPISQLNDVIWHFGSLHGDAVATSPEYPDAA